jgi:hypothetical protein
MIETTTRWWRGLREFAPLFMAPLWPGVTLFALLLWLSLRYVREGFGDVRQYAFAPAAGTGSLRSFAHRNWWSCTCDSAACRCLAGIARAARRCCVKLLDLTAVRLAPAL